MYFKPCELIITLFYIIQVWNISHYKTNILLRNINNRGLFLINSKKVRLEYKRSILYSNFNESRNHIS
ncbi:hypothetical protein C4B62_04210 [Serratia marcescens]|nr:hypothetical protein C4B62_04210 [Serratia marcescens]